MEQANEDDPESELSRYELNELEEAARLIRLAKHSLEDAEELLPSETYFDLLSTTRKTRKDAEALHLGILQTERGNPKLDGYTFEHDRLLILSDKGPSG